MSSQPPSRDPNAPSRMAEQDSARGRTMSELQRQLEEAQHTIRRLTRELAKEQARHAQTSEAYSKTVTNMVEVARENALLTHELERLKRSTRSSSLDMPNIAGIDLKPSEVKAIRKAMARLHHPDVGGDEQRMKVWNSMLDQLEEDD